MRNQFYFTRFFVCALLCFCILSARAQYFDLDNSKRETIPFKFVRDLVVIQLKINDKGPYNFIIDTGVGFMLITDPSLADSLKMLNNRTLKMTGLGEGKDFEAFITQPLKVDIPGLISHNISAAILKKDHFNLSQYAGMPIHGLLGYEFFSQLAVKISFNDSTLTLSNPRDMRIYKKAAKIPISIEDKKPYFKTRVVFADGTKKESKLIIDLGAGHFVSMENIVNKDELQNKSINNADLGIGIKGRIVGSLSRINEINLGKYTIKNVICAFPNDDTRLFATPRDGNLGMGLLKKFDVIFDYPDSVMYLRPSYDFKTKSEYDMSGLAYFSTGNNYSHIVIYNVEPGSAGEHAGLKKEDEIMAINFKPVNQMNIQQIDDLFKSQDNRSLIMLIYRNKKYQTVFLTLKRRI